jgi:prolipoprotein diacylglyceryltransferase
MLCNAVVGIAMARLWSLHLPTPLIIGLYLIMTGLGRFVEEAYRGEPQTAVHGGLRLYQWLAVATVLAGIGITMADGSPSAPRLAMNWESVVAAIVFGMFTTLVTGLDFPNSQRRFARLA